MACTLDNITLPPAPTQSKDFEDYKLSVERWTRQCEQTVRQFERTVRCLLTNQSAATSTAAVVTTAVAGPQGVQGPAGPQGPPGVAGPAGASGATGAGGPAAPAGGSITVSVVAAENIPAYAVVTSTGRVANSATVAHLGKVIGVALAAITSGASGQVVPLGEVQNLSWTWVSGDVLFLNAAALSTVAPVAGFSQIIGTAKNSTTIIVELESPILL